MELEANEASLIGEDQDPLFENDFNSMYPVTGDAVFQAHFQTGRTWESEETEKGMTIRTTPDPDVVVYPSSSGYIAAIAVMTPDRLIMHAIQVSHDDVADVLIRMVGDIEEFYDGISGVSTEYVEDGYDSYRDAVAEKVDDILAEASFEQ